MPQPNQYSTVAPTVLSGAFSLSMTDIFSHSDEPPIRSRSTRGSDVIPTEGNHPPFEDGKKGRGKKKAAMEFSHFKKLLPPPIFRGGGGGREFYSAIKSAIKVATIGANVVCEHSRARTITRQSSRAIFFPFHIYFAAILNAIKIYMITYGSLPLQ